MKIATFCLTILLTSAGFAKPTLAPKKKENHKDIIQKAQSLTIQKDRVQGTKVILRVLEDKTLNEKTRQELQSALQEISTLFYTEKTQKTFEYAKSLLRDSPQESLEKFQEALIAEPNNILILLWTARNALFRGKCDEAETNASKALDLNPYNAYLQLVRMQALACLQQFVAFDKAATEYTALESAQPLYFNMVMAQKLFSEKNYSKAYYYVEKAKQIDKDYPEIYYWEAQILEKLDRVVRDPVSRFVRSCKVLTPADYYKYEIEPRLCQQHKTFEAEYRGLLEKEKKDFE